MERCNKLLQHRSFHPYFCRYTHQWNFYWKPTNICRDWHNQSYHYSISSTASSRQPSASKQFHLWPNALQNWFQLRYHIHPIICSHPSIGCSASAQVATAPLPNTKQYSKHFWNAPTCAWKDWSRIRWVSRWPYHFWLLTRMFWISQWRVWWIIRMRICI